MKIRWGFTLLELLIVLAIGALLVGGASFAISSLLRERQLHKPTQQIRQVIQQSVRKSAQENQPWQLIFINREIFAAPLSQDPKQVIATQDPACSLPQLSELSIFPSAADGWLLANRTPIFVYIDHAHFAPPFQIRLRSKYGWIEQTFDPLTGELINQSSSTKSASNTSKSSS